MTTGLGMLRRLDADALSSAKQRLEDVAATHTATKMVTEKRLKAAKGVDGESACRVHYATRCRCRCRCRCLCQQTIQHFHIFVRVDIDTPSACGAQHRCVVTSTSE